MVMACYQSYHGDITLPVCIVCIFLIVILYFFLIPFLLKDLSRTFNLLDFIFLKNYQTVIEMRFFLSWDARKKAHNHIYHWLAYKFE